MFRRPEINDRLGRRFREGNNGPLVTILRSFWGQFPWAIGVLPWLILLINDLLLKIDISVISDKINSPIVCAVVAVALFGLASLIAHSRSRMITYIFPDNIVYIPGTNSREDTRARSFVGIYDARILPPTTGFFLSNWILRARRFIFGYRDIVIRCPGNESDGTIILRGIGKVIIRRKGTTIDTDVVYRGRRIVDGLNESEGLKVAESTSVAYNRPSNSDKV